MRAVAAGILLATTLGGCKYGIIDATNSPLMKIDLSGHCYKLQSDSFVYEASCLDPEAGGFGGKARCLKLQSFSAFDPLRTPGSYEVYLLHTDVWDRKLFPKVSPF